MSVYTRACAAGPLLHQCPCAVDEQARARWASWPWELLSLPTPKLHSLYVELKLIFKEYTGQIGIGSLEAPFRELWKIGHHFLYFHPLFWEIENKFLNHWCLNFPDGQNEYSCVGLFISIWVLKTSLILRFTFLLISL